MQIVTDYLLAAALVASGFALGWVWRSYLETRRKRERARIRAITGARRTVARPGTSTSQVRKASLSRSPQLKVGNLPPNVRDIRK